MPFPAVTSHPVDTLQLLSVTRSVLASYEFLSRSGGEARFNVAPLKPVGSERQNYRGDRRRLLANLSFVLRVDGLRPVAMRVLLEQLRLTRALKINDYSLILVGSAGITSWGPLGSGQSRVEVEFIPAYAMWMDDVLRFMSGEPWVFRLPQPDVGAFNPVRLEVPRAELLVATRVPTVTPAGTPSDDVVLFDDEVVTFNGNDVNFTA